MNRCLAMALRRAALLALSACSVASGARFGHSTTTASSGSEPGAPSASGPTAHPGVLWSDELKPLLGMTVDEAKQYLRKVGHTGPVTISTLGTFDDACGVDRICDVEHPGGVGVTGEITLDINPVIETAEPRL
jgi:hypothetical protein